jgi:hypothetical protein
LTTATALADLHPSIGRRVRRRRSIAYGCHAFTGGVMLLAAVANVVDADGLLFWMLDGVLSHPATLFAVAAAAVAGPAYTFSARWEIPLAVLAGLTAAVVGLLAAGPLAPGWAGNALFWTWVVASSALPGHWMLRGRSEFSRRAGIE